MEDNGEGEESPPPAGGGIRPAAAVDPPDRAAAAPLAVIEEDDTDEEEQQFDITLAASHTYMGPGLVVVSGRSVLEAGWEGRVPALAHHGTVFPGETVPMRLPNPNDAAVLTQAIKNDKLFGLLCPDESGTLLSGYGVLCEVFEAGDSELNLTFKARASHRFRMRDMPRKVPIHTYTRMKHVDVVVLGDTQPTQPLRRARLAGIDTMRGRPDNHTTSRLVRQLDASVTPWPSFVYESFSLPRMRARLAAHFSSVRTSLPSDAVGLSFWTAANLPLAAADRLRLFTVDDALLRLHMEVNFISKKSILCCGSCTGDIARSEHIFAMSSDGVHSNYTNLGGYMHDIVTVTRTMNTELSGAPSAEYSWFPGYTWTIALCVSCMAHVGWRFDAMKRNLRPQQFYGLCRNYTQPRLERETSSEDESDPLEDIPRTIL